ncbi:hypothetical protein LUZ63_007415 [Rhynchospora breviuscula]|uniref:Uncharacterized protein n=1 Tax=Rhynchospora breviuscula TaxID=2022672 RepID=A0A9Q0CRM6_9POAL|nr:hypothetical protein LUZ63_007415 [Rhynchospora breviuscula]
MKTKAAVLSFSQRCRNILVSNWEAHLHTIKTDAKGSKGAIHSSKVHYMFHRGRPLLLVPEGDLHNMNTIIDERGSLSVCSNVPGPLMTLLKSLNKLPARVAMTGDVVPVKDKKVQAIIDSLNESVLREHKIASKFSHSVSAILTSAGPRCNSRSEGLRNILNQIQSYNLYKFDIGSCAYMDGSNDTHDVDLEDLEEPKSDLLFPFSAKLIDGINQSQTRRRALMLFCFEYFNAIARDALMLSIDQNGFDVLAKVPQTLNSTGDAQQYQYHWKEFRFNFKEEAADVESFCQMLVELEEEALQHVKSYSGLG